jgi:hypothetical protein
VGAYFEMLLSEHTVRYGPMAFGMEWNGFRNRRPQDVQQKDGLEDGFLQEGFCTIAGGYLGIVRICG